MVDRRTGKCALSRLDHNVRVDADQTGTPGLHGFHTLGHLAHHQDRDAE